MQNFYQHLKTGEDREDALAASHSEVIPLMLSTLFVLKHASSTISRLLSSSRNKSLNYSLPCQRPSQLRISCHQRVTASAGLELGSGRGDWHQAGCLPPVELETYSRCQRSKEVVLPHMSDLLAIHQRGKSSNSSETPSAVASIFIAPSMALQATVKTAGSSRPLSITPSSSCC